MISTRESYTLVVPTYNRPQLLNALLRFLDRTSAEFPIIIIDSSASTVRHLNRDLVGRIGLSVQYVECDEATPPFEKFRDGVHRVRTPFCGLCADDDLVIVDGIRRCLEHLEGHPDVSVAHGYYFTFLENGSGAGGMDLFSVPYYAPSIDSVDPVSRLRQLFRNYQALTYGTYRTPVLTYIFDTVRPVESLLARELLSSALAVVQGKATRLRCFTNGRSFGASAAYRHWHPLEWLIDSPEGLFEEYRRYREILIRELIATPGWGRSLEITQRTVDVIHLLYLLRHAPAETYDFILDHVMSEKDTYEFWPAMEIQLPLIRASRYLPPPAARPPEAMARDVIRHAARLFRRLRPRLRGHGARPPIEPVEQAESTEAVRESWPRCVKTTVRRYRLHEEFVRPHPSDLFSITKEDVRRLLEVMDHYEQDGPA